MVDNELYVPIKYYCRCRICGEDFIKSDSIPSGLYEKFRQDYEIFFSQNTESTPRIVTCVKCKEES